MVFTLKVVANLKNAKTSALIKFLQSPHLHDLVHVMINAFLLMMLITLKGVVIKLKRFLMIWI